MTPVARRGQALALVVAAAALGPGCQLFGERPRCDPENDRSVQACPADQFCAPDGFCAPKRQLDACAPAAVPASRPLHLGVAAAGVQAMGDTIGDGVSVLVVGDAHLCNAVARGCPGQSANPAGAQPLGAVTGVSGFAGVSTRLELEDLHFPVGGAFTDGVTVEAVFRSSAQAPGATLPIASMVDGSDGWILEEAVDGSVVLVAGRARATLAAPSPATWHHVLCTVDAAAVGAAGFPADAVLCAVDGAVASPAEDIGGRRTLAAPHDLVVGAVPDDALSAVEVAVVRVWPTARPYDAGDALARIDALVDDERARVFRYLGLVVDVPDDGAPRFRSTNSGNTVRALRVNNALADAFELVPAGWPRLAHSADGTQGGVLLEPTRENRLDPGVAGCTAGATSTSPSLSGRLDACVYDVATPVELPLSHVSQRHGPDAQPDFGPGSAFVFSAFLHTGTHVGASLAIEVEGAGAPFNDGDCTIVDDSVLGPVRSAGSDGDCSIEVFDDGWVRMVDRFIANAIEISVHVHAKGEIWSPQLELGNDPSTPLSRARTRKADEIVIDAPGLADATSTALRATVLTDGVELSMSPLLVAADADHTDHTAKLVVAPAAPGTIAPRLVVTEQARQEVSAGTFAFTQGQSARFGGDLGPQVDACDGCLGGTLAATLPASEQWEEVGLVGAGEPGLLVNADVVTSGSAPLPLALDIVTGPPQSGCLDGERPDVALVACKQGACSEDAPVVWTGPKNPSVKVGPSIDESGVAGLWSTNLGTDARSVDELYLEARFEPDGSDGDVVALSDGAHVFLRVEADHGDLVVSDNFREALRAPSTLHAGEWTQLSCWLGLQSRCVVNAGDPQDIGVVVVTGHTLKAVAVGGGAAHTAFFRLWHELPQKPKVEIDRSLGARVAASFGLIAAPRRAPFDVLESRTGAGIVERNGEKLKVGPHWPRLVDEGGGAVYAADAGEGIAFVTRDLTDAERVSLDMSFSKAPAGPLVELDNDTETLSFVKNGTELDVHHDGDATVVLNGLDPNGVSFGARGNLVVLERLGGPAIAVTAQPLSDQPMTRAVVGGGASPLRLRSLRVGTR